MSLPEGIIRQNYMWISLLDLENLTFSVPIFCTITHDPSVYHSWKKNTQFCSNWVLFAIIAQNTPNLCNLGSFISNENPQIDPYTKILRNSIPEGRHIYVYHVNVRTPQDVTAKLLVKSVDKGSSIGESALYVIFPSHMEGGHDILECFCFCARQTVHFAFDAFREHYCAAVML